MLGIVQGLLVFQTCHLAAAVIHCGNRDHTLEEFPSIALLSSHCHTDAGEVIH